MDTQDINNNQVAESSKKGGFGPLVGILIVVVLLAFGGLYFWGSHLMGNDDEMMEAQAPQNFEVTSTTVEDGGTMTDEEFEALFNETAPDNRAEATLDSAVDDLSDLDNLDAELDAIDSEL